MRGKVKILLLLVNLLLGHYLFSQQDPMYSMYMFDKMLINPAFTGSSNWIVNTVKYRQQFIGFDGNPTTTTFNFHAPIQKKHIGLGFKVISDKIAVTDNLAASLFFSYHLNFGGGKLSLGLEGGILNKKINYSNLDLTNLDDPIFRVASSSSTASDLSFGIYYQKKKFYGGISAAHILKDIFISKPDTSFARLYTQANIIAGYDFDLSKSFHFEPSVLIKYVKAAPPQADLNLMLSYNDRVAIGAQYRTGDAFVAIFRINILEGLRIAYAYDITLSSLKPYSKGAQEIIISYGIKLPPPPAEKEVHPRYYF